ncbi:MAG: 50S ribosomal protein L24 [Eubacteriales bacterium]|nr:50S ribosomal protein L24 [Eubacteriales bacterium]MDD4476104.1 50S ribosomal protein L24 [Eubacteriales bacterium]
MNKKIHIKTGDTVVVISGKNKYAKIEDGKKEKAIGKVIAVSPAEGKVIVEGVNIVSKHVKPRRQGEPGGIIKTESALYASKVQLYCPKCDAGRRTRREINEAGQKVRKCSKCGTIL